MTPIGVTFLKTVKETMESERFMQIVQITALVAAVLLAISLSVSMWASGKVANMYGSETVTNQNFLKIGLPILTGLSLVNLLPLFKGHKAALTISYEMKSPAPGKCHLNENFLKVGDEVEVNSVLCTIEVMKMEISIRSPVKGKIAEIYVKDNALVSAQAPLMRILPT